MQKGGTKNQGRTDGRQVCGLVGWLKWSALGGWLVGWFVRSIASSIALI